MRLRRKIIRPGKLEEKKKASFFSKPGNEEKAPFFSGTHGLLRKLNVGKSNDPQEKEADAAAKQLTQQMVQRAEKREEEKPVQKEEKKEEEKPVQKEEKKEEEKPVQKEEKKEEEKPVQKEEKKEEEKPVQKEEKKEEEKPVQKEEKKEEEKPIQKKEMKEEGMPVQKAAENTEKEGAGSREAPDLESILARRKGMGSELPEDVRLEMEKKMKASFKDVRIHSDVEAEELCEQIHAQAFTHGKDIYFNKGKYMPGSDTGKELLAHELTHVLQQQR
jgi:outer membrane biosynthesis protein TonB